METVWTVILGAIQGATEFLPVSSSGHLAAGQMVMALSGAEANLSDQPLTLEILLHVATLMSVIVYFRRDIWLAILGAGSAVAGIFGGRFNQVIKENDGANLALCVVVGTLPTGVLGFALEDAAGLLSKNPTALGLSFLFCAAVLIASRWWKGGDKRISWKLALIIGLVQGIAVLPGISRSGVTITVALALGLGREQAAKFSFLLSIPAILGAAVLKLDLAALTADGKLLPYSFGAIAAFCVGLGALYLLVRIVKAGRFWLFAPYVGAVGICTLLFL